MIACGVFAWNLSWRGTDAWPLTRYPMFSRRLEPGDVRVVRFRLVVPDGSMEWWNPRFYRYADRIGDAVLTAGTPGLLWGAAEVLRLLALEGDSCRYSAIVAVERRWDGNAAIDRVLARIPIPFHAV